MIKTIILAALLGIVAAELQSYRPRGWRPAGPAFEPSRGDRLQTYGSPLPSQSYGAPPVNRPAYPKPSTTTTEPPTTTTTEIPTTTTPRSREPTTTPNIPDQDFESNPALAIANSFAFNRPVYVYNTYPLHAGLTFVR